MLSEIKEAHALRSKPSRAAAMAMVCLSWALVCFRLFPGRVASNQRERRSPASQRDIRSTVKVEAAFEWAFPPRGGAHKTHFGNMASSVQAATVFNKTAIAKVRIKHLAQRSLAFNGTCFTVGMRLRKISSNVGRSAVFETCTLLGAFCAASVPRLAGALRRSARRHEE